MHIHIYIYIHTKQEWCYDYVPCANINSRDAPIIGSVIGNADYRLIFSYRLSDRYAYQISSRSDIICGQSQSIGN